MSVFIREERFKELASPYKEHHYTLTQENFNAACRFKGITKPTLEWLFYNTAEVIDDKRPKCRFAVVMHLGRDPSEELLHKHIEAFLYPDKITELERLRAENEALKEENDKLLRESYKRETSNTD